MPISSSPYITISSSNQGISWYYGAMSTGVNSMETIGGSTCHLCGRELKYKSVYGRRTRKRGWVEHIRASYACHTVVETTERGKKRITLGSECVKVVK
jgi:hypothetical protein